MTFWSWVLHSELNLVVWLAEGLTRSSAALISFALVQTSVYRFINIPWAWVHRSKDLMSPYMAFFATKQENTTEGNISPHEVQHITASRYESHCRMIFGVHHSGKFVSSHWFLKPKLWWLPSPHSLSFVQTHKNHITILTHWTWETWKQMQIFREKAVIYCCAWILRVVFAHTRIHKKAGCRRFSRTSFVPQKECPDAISSNRMGCWWGIDPGKTTWKIEE